MSIGEGSQKNNVHWGRFPKMLENRPEDALGSLVETVETVETVEIGDCRDWRL